LGIYGFLLSAQRTSCSRQRGSPWSSPLRSDGCRDDQAGEVGLVEQKLAEAKSLKTKGQGTVWLPLKWDSSGERATLTIYLLKKGQLTSSSLLDWKGQKAACQRKRTTDKTERKLTLNSGCCCRRQGWWRWRCRWMRTRRADHKSVWQHFSV
jgi:hypothetical protein